jgi:phosphoglycerol transferase
MALSLAIAALVLKLWRADLSVPIFENHGDATFTLASMKGLIEHGWYETDRNLGAPFGQVNHDFAVYIGELGNVLIVKALALFTSNVALVMNAFVLLSFPLAALTSFLVQRRLGLSRPVALVCSVLFAVGPYHFVQAQQHMFLANYFGLPISAYLILAILGDEQLLARRDDASSGMTVWLSRRTLTTVALSLIVGLAGLYYAAFTCFLVALGAVVVGAFSRRWSTPIAGMVVIFAIALPVAATALPEVIYRSEHGTNQVVAERKPVASLIFGLQPIQLVLPIPGDRFAPLAHLRARYDQDQGTPGTPSLTPPAYSLGLVGAIGLVWLLACLVAAGVGRKLRDPLAGRVGTAALMAILLGTIGGGGALFAYVITPQIRVWERIAILIGFFALLGAGLILEAANHRLMTSPRGKLPAAAVLVVVLVFGVFEGTSSRFVPSYSRYATEWHSDAAFVGQIQHSLPRDAMVLELPYVPYPEVALPDGLTSYSLLEPYLHSRTLRWSGGAMAGRPTDWLAVSSRRPLDQLIPGAVAAGFSGVYIDRRGYADGGASIAHQVQSIMGATPIAESSGKAYFFDLLRYAAALRGNTASAKLAAMASDTIHPQ